MILNGSCVLSGEEGELSSLATCQTQSKYYIW